ncbi:glycoside hydrolase family 15 protein [Pseudomonas sp. EA_35y_Pfl2_R111]|uniref:glycoside hydrolase family 15 protein n=1 Tax=Pseudomonas sp. EA_35y_Pfl2_R111 TaxID=3088689 RepID=UPI0030D8279A
MSQPIEDYALIGDLRCAALVGRNGSIDWFCPPRFDAPACFAALLGRAEHGHWQLSPVGEVLEVRRYYQPDTLVLCTEMITASGRVKITDCMPLGDDITLLRRVEVLSGQVAMRMSLLPRFGYGARAAECEHSEAGVSAWNGEERLLLRSDQPADVEEGHIRALFSLGVGESRSFQLCYLSPGQVPGALIDSAQQVEDCAKAWRGWVVQCSYHGRWREAVVRSLITLKALTYAPSGGMVAAPTTSLPEVIGGEANWDYRFCWIRDAVLALDILLDSNYFDEARHWRDWLLRVLDGEDGELAVLYSVSGEAPLDEEQLSWLPGYKGSQPVRIGNAASTQHQLDLQGQLIDLLHLARRSGVDMYPETWQRQCSLVNDLVERWRDPDDGIWELRGERRHFTHSKIYAWVAFDRSIRDAETFGWDAPLARWRQARDELRADICRNGIDTARGAFKQSYEEAEPDASLLMIPLLGFLPIKDERVQATIAWVEQELYRDELVYRFRQTDAFAGEEGAFLPCSFWLVDNWVMSGRDREAEALFERLLALRNDVGLLAEEYDPRHGFLGNFPQAFSHLALIKSAYLIEACERVHRGGEPERHSYKPVD